MNEPPFTSSWNSWLPTEPDLRSLYEWLDTNGVQHRQRKAFRTWGIASGVSYALAGAAIGVFTGVMHVPAATHPEIIGVPLVVAALSSAISGVVIAVKNRRGNDLSSQAFHEARMFTWQLISARWKGSVKRTIGNERALVLNEAAGYVLRGSRALGTHGWNASGADSEIAQMGRRVREAMNVSMARLVGIVGRGASSDDAEVQQIVTELKDACFEAERTAKRLDTLSLNAPQDLRQAISEMRMLNQAQDEVDEYQRQV